MIWLRSILYWLAVPVVTPFFCILAILILPLPPVQRYRIIRGWSWIMLKWLKLTCGLTYRVEGLENLPDSPSVVMCKHQSAWETLALQHVFPPQVWVLKKELLKMPVFGWGLDTLSPIAIVPVAVNSGEFWPRNSFLKWPGEITMVVGKPIDPTGRSPQDLTHEVETWIENEILRFGGVGPCYSPKK